jgi:two-component system phosphate regulon response regulator PhoB
MDTVIGGGSIVLDRTIDVHVKMLRRKLDEVREGAAYLVETVRGVGFRLRET